jgi:hypothetical protein
LGVHRGHSYFSAISRPVIMNEWRKAWLNISLGIGQM